jgi:hypothetical protein
MNIDDNKILETIERLAREAGAKQLAQRPDLVRFETDYNLTPKPSPAPEPAVKTAKYMLSVISSCDTIEDNCEYYVFSDGSKLTYGEIRSLKQWVEEQEK